LAGDCRNHPRIKKSKFFKQFIDIPKACFEEVDENQHTLESVLSIIESQNIDVLVPSDFESLKFLASFESNLSNKAKVVPLPDYQQIQLLDNKVKCCRFLDSKSVIIPKTIYVENIDEYKVEALKDITFPVFVKSAFSAGGVGNCMIKDMAQLKSYLEMKRSSNEQLLIQEYIEGIDYCFNAYAVQGEVKTWTTFRYIELDSNGSKGVFAQFVPDQAIIEESKRIISLCNYTGPIVIDYRKDAISGTPYFIEINPRFGNNSHYSLVDGVNFINCGISLAQNETVPPTGNGDAMWSCNLKRLFSAPIRKLDISAFYYIFKVGLPQLMAELKRTRKINGKF